MTHPAKTLCPSVFFLLLLLGLSNQGLAENVDLVFQVSAPNSAEGLDIYLAGNFQNWDPGQPKYRLTEIGEGKYEIPLSLKRDAILQFKFTRGNWGTVEKGPRGEEIPNRTLRVSDPGHQVFEIAAWADQNPGSTPVSSVVGLVEEVHCPGFLPDRKVLIYLPPNYFTSDARYPVLYMLDGQNVFDAATSFAGEWKVDETCEELIASKRMRPLIVVAIANGSQKRSFEYTPWVNPDFRHGRTGGGDQHLRAIIDQLMPHINEHYRTLVEPGTTGLAGSSFGGLMALFAAGTYPETFGLIAAVSPSLEWNHGGPVEFARQRIQPGIRIYLDMGGRESDLPDDGDGNGVDDSLDALRNLKRALEAKGFESELDLMVVEEGSGQHNEAFWARRFPAALVFLFPPEAPTH